MDTKLDDLMAMASAIEKAKGKKVKLARNKTRMDRGTVIFGGEDIKVGAFNHHRQVLAAIQRFAGADIRVDVDVAAAQAFQQARGLKGFDVDKAYVKVALVGNELCFRIKQDRGKFGKDIEKDVTLVADWKKAIDDHVAALKLQQEIEECLKAAVKSLLDDGGSIHFAYENFSGSIDQLDVAIKSRDVNNAHRCYARVAKAISNDPLGKRAVRIMISDAAGTNKVDVDELTPKVERDPRMQDILRRYERDPDRVRILLESLDALTEEIGESATSDLTSATSTDREYQSHLAEIQGEYKKIAKFMKETVALFSQQAAYAKRLVAAQLQRPAAADERLLEASENILKAIQPRGKAAVTEFAKIRNSSGSVKQQEALYQIHKADQGKFLTPFMNMTFTEWYKGQSHYQFAVESTRSVLAKFLEIDSTHQRAKQLAQMAAENALSGSGG